MADLPVKPSLDHLRRQARDLLRAARAGDTTAAGRIRAVADALTLASAQLAVAREYGFASRTRLRDEVTARTVSLARQAEAFCEASIRDGTGRAARMLLDVGADPNGRTGEEYGVARLTANKALRLLVTEGLAVLSPGMGFHVRTDIGQN
jgi:hypothetical protein